MGDSIEDIKRSVRRKIVLVGSNRPVESVKNDAR